MAETTAPENRDKTRKPPRGRPFAPGNSANPGGRPKLDPDLVAFCREKTLEYAQRLHELATDPKASPDFVLRVFVEFSNRAYGKPTEFRELSGDLFLQVLSSYAAEKAGAAEVAGHG